MQDTVQGTVMPVLEVMLDPGETVVSEAGEFSWMTDTISMATGSGGGHVGGGGGGLMGALKRVASGSTFLFNTYTAQGGPGLVAFAAKQPGKIIPIDITPENEYLCHRHGFLAGMPGVEISVALQQSFKGGIFGGEGFLLQRIGGTSKVWFELSGEVLAYDLVAGQTMRAHPGHVGLFQASVSFQIQKVPGISNRYLGQDGHHFVLLSGPGRVYLQSMPIAILAGALDPYLDKEGHPAATGFGAGMLGGMLGDR